MFQIGVDTGPPRLHTRPMTTTLHAHVDTYATDCDGGHGYDYVMGFNDDEIAERETANGINDFSDIRFMGRVMLAVASPYAVQFGMTVRVDENGIEVHEPTEEGSRNASVRWCHDQDCDPNAVAVFDQYAEMMGY